MTVLVSDAGVYAMFDGPTSPLTQTFGLGMFDRFTEREFEEVERFFNTRGATTAHEACSFADRNTVSVLGARGYSPIEASVVLMRPTAIPTDSSPQAMVVTQPRTASYRYAERRGFRPAYTRAKWQHLRCHQ
jgi:hypothetical protein